MQLHTFKLENGRTVQIVTERTKNDTNGNPIYLVTVFMVNQDGHGFECAPLGLGITRKDGKLRTQSYLGHARLAQQVFDKLQAIFKEAAQ